MDLGSWPTAAFGVALGVVIASVGAWVGGRGWSDLRLRLLGRSAVAVVTRTETEPPRGDVLDRDWTVVEFTDHTGRLHRDVRLRSWSTVPPVPGRLLRVYYDPDRPTVVERSRIVLPVVRLLLAPAMVGLGVVVAAAVVVWGAASSGA